MKRNIILKTLTVAILGTAALQVQAQGIYVNKKNHESIAYPKSVLDKVTPKSKQSSSTESPEWKWERIADMNTARMGHQIFPSGDGFVVVGGHTTDFQLTKTAEIYQNGKWTNISISNPHDGGFSVILGDGRVMVGGGFSSAKGVGQSKKTDIYDPKTQSFTAGPDMTVARAYAKAILMNGKVYVNGNWYADNKVMDCYDGSSFSSVGNMRNFTLPYIFASKSGTIWTWSLMDPWGETVDWGTSSSGSQGLLFNKYLVSTDETKSSLFTNMVTNVPLSLSEDVRMSNSYSAKDDRYYFLTKNSNSYKLYYSLIDESSIGWYNFDVPTVYPNTDVEINYRGSVFVNDAKEEVYLVGSNGPSNNQTLFLVCYNFADENVVHRTIAKIDGFEHNLMSGAWTILNDGRLVCTGGGINSNFDAQKYAYIFTPPVAGMGDTEPDPGTMVDRNFLVIETKDHVQTTYMLAEKPEVRFEGTNLRVVSAKADVTYQLTDILRFTYEKRSVTGVSELQTTPATVDYEDGELVISGIKAGAAVGVYSLDGKLVRQLTAQHAGTYRLSLSALPRGVYVVKADNVTYKVSCPPARSRPRTHSTSSETTDASMPSSSTTLNASSIRRLTRWA